MVSKKNFKELGTTIIGMCMYLFFFSIFMLPLCLFFAIIEGFVLSQMWSWFVVPITSLPELTIAQAFGLGLLVSHVTRDYTLNVLKEDIQKEQWKVFTFVTGRPFAMLLGGYVCKTYFM